MKNIAVITGASSGLGREFAKIIDSKYDDSIDEIWLIARNKNALLEVAKEFKHKVKVFDIDLSRSYGLNMVRKIFSSETISIKCLVNAAGFGIKGDFVTNSYSQVRDMIRVNCEALTSITYNAINYMTEGSRIINFASSAAFMPQPKFNVYAATKSYVLSFSRALSKELSKKGIIVTAVCPGPVKTSFFDRAGKIHHVFEDMKMAMPFDVSYLAFCDSIKKKEISVYSLKIKLFRVLTKLVTHSLLLNLYNLYLNAKDKDK